MLNDGDFKNNEHIDVYFVRLPQHTPADQFVVQASEVRLVRTVFPPPGLVIPQPHTISAVTEQVSEVRWIHARDLLEAWDSGDPTFVGNSGDTEVSFFALAYLAGWYGLCQRLGEQSDT